MLFRHPLKTGRHRSNWGLKLAAQSSANTNISTSTPQLFLHPGYVRSTDKQMIILWALHTDFATFGGSSGSARHQLAPAPVWHLRKSPPARPNVAEPSINTARYASHFRQPGYHMLLESTRRAECSSPSRSPAAAECDSMSGGLFFSLCAANAAFPLSELRRKQFLPSQL